MALEAVIFDMDGTLVDSMPFHALAWKQFLAEYGMVVTDEELREKGHGTLYDIMPRFFGAHISRARSYELAMQKEALFRRIYEPHMKALGGVSHWLGWLKERGIKVGLGTAADFTNTDFTIDALELRHFFDVLVTSDLVAEGKPSPAVYLYAAEKLAVSPENCLVFEDTFSGVAAAKAAGMAVAAITTMHGFEEWEGHNLTAIIEHYDAPYDKILKGLFI